MSPTTDDEIQIRSATLADRDAVLDFTENTWSDRADDYLPRVFEDWVRSDGPDRRTLVADRDGRAVGLLQVVLLSATEAWAQGMRVAPDERGRGIGAALTRAGLDWAADSGATVCRNMVFSWNVAGLGVSRAAGFAPGTEFRWSRPEPREVTPELDVRSDPAAAWSFWTGSDARTHLRGLGLDPDETWACSEVTRERFERAAEETALFAVVDGGTRGAGYRTRTYEREGDGTDGPQRWAEYGLGAWTDGDVAAARALHRAIAADAAALDADRTRVLIPETVGWVSDAAACRVRVSDEPDFVMRADLSDR